MATEEQEGSPNGSGSGSGAVAASADADPILAKTPPPPGPEDLDPEKPNQRYIVGCLGDMEEAKRRWKLSLEWRREEGIDAILDEPQPYFDLIKEVGAWVGCGVWGGNECRAIRNDTLNDTLSPIPCARVNSATRTTTARRGGTATRSTTSARGRYGLGRRTTLTCHARPTKKTIPQQRSHTPFTLKPN